MSAAARVKRRRPPAIKHRTGLHGTRPMVAGASVVPPIFAVDDPRCVACGRRRSAHGAPVEVGGERVVPACHLIHRGGVFRDEPTPARPRPLDERMAVAHGMSPQEARRITGSLGHTSKMPGASYGLDAWQCRRGSELASDPRSMCHPDTCYAKKDFYATYHNAVKARHTRQAAIEHDLWVEAMIVLITDYVAQGTDDAVFRWHDSGDVQSVLHFANICAVAEGTPHVRHWIPTREYAIVSAYRAAGGGIPANLVVRLSAERVDERPPVPPELADLPTSTVNSVRGAPTIAKAPGYAAVECGSGRRDNKCGACRACWSPRVDNVSYPAH